MTLLSNFRLRKQLNKDGIFVESSYLLYLNNLDPITFPDRSHLFEYLRNFRKENDIFKLQMFRVDTYSL